MRFAAIVCAVLAALMIFPRSSHADGVPKWDPNSLKEIRTLATMPEGVRATIGGLADVGEPFNPTDVGDRRPRQRFILGGSSDSSALVIYEAGGIALVHKAIGYVRVNSHWTENGHWNLPRRPTSLRDALDLITSKSAPG